MRKLIFFFVFVVPTFSFSIGQDSTAQTPRTNLGKANVKIGTVLRKEFIDLLTLKGKGFLSTENLTVQILKINDAASGEQFAGLYLSTYDAGGSYSSGQVYSAYIDADEIPGLINFLELLLRNQGQIESNYVEYLFSSRDLQVYAYNKKDKKGQSVWEYGLRVDRYYRRSAVSLQIKDVEELKAKLNDAVLQLNAKTTPLQKVSSQ